MKALIINVSKTEFTNKDTGEVVDYCKITIGELVETSDNFAGYITQEVTTKSENFEKLLKYSGKIVDIDTTFKKVDRKNYHIKITKIGDDTL